MSKKLENLEKLYGFKRGDGYSKYGTTMEEREEMFNLVKNAGYKVKGEFEPNSNYVFRSKQMIFAPTNVGYHYFKRKYNVISPYFFKLKFTPVVDEEETSDLENKKVIFKSIQDNSGSNTSTNLDKQYENWFADSLIKGSYNYEK